MAGFSKDFLLQSKNENFFQWLYSIDCKEIKMFLGEKMPERGPFSRNWVASHTLKKEREGGDAL